MISRVIDRGSRSINFALSAIIFNVAPTALEVLLVSGLLAVKLGEVVFNRSLNNLHEHMNFLKY